MTIRDFAAQNNLRLRRDSAGDLIVAGRRTANDFPKQREYANHVYHGFADDGLGVCLLFTTRKKWTTTRRMLELAGCLLTQNGDTEGCLTFDPTNAEQVQAVIKAAGLKARRTASPAQLAVLASMAQLRSVGSRSSRRWGFCGENALYDSTHCSGGRAMKLSDFTHNFKSRLSEHYFWLTDGQ